MTPKNRKNKGFSNKAVKWIDENEGVEL